MATIRDEGVCIRHWDWSETSQTVSVLTRAHGLVRGLAKGARREKGGFSGGIELLTRGEVGAIVKGTGALATLTSWDLLETFPVVRGSLGSYYAAMYMADVAGRLLREDDPHAAAYDALVLGLRSLSGAGGADPALLRFQWALLGACGYAPELERDLGTGRRLAPSRTYAFAPGLGGLVAEGTEVAGPTWGVRAATVCALRSVSRGVTAGDDRPASIERANRLLASYVREILGSEPPSMGLVFGGAGAGPGR